MPHSSGKHGQTQSTGSEGKLIPPKGFHSELYPLRHKFQYSFGLSAVDAADNSTIMTLVKNYKTLNAPDTIEVNPHNTNFERETGAICQPMSIIDRLSLTMRFSLTKTAETDNMFNVHFQWTPIFFSFPEKLDAADDDTTTTVADILELTKDATQEDVTPTWTGTKLAVAGPSDTAHPVSTSNMTEVFGTLNLTTDTTMEGVAFDKEVFHSALQYYSNRGALKACLGRTRSVVLTEASRFSEKTFFIKKFVPRSVRRIMPYSFFGILVHVPLVSEFGQTAIILAGTAAKPHITCRALIQYHEWNIDHYQEKSGTGP